MKLRNILVGTIAGIAALSVSSVGAQEPYRVGDLIKDLGNLDPEAELAAPVVVQTTDTETNVYPGSDSVVRFSSLVVSTRRCGGLGPPVIYIQPGGGFEYHWCDGGSKVAWVDTWVYVFGSAQFYGSMDVPCNGGSMPAPVRKIVCS